MNGNRILSIGNAMASQNAGPDMIKRQEEASEVMFADMLSMSSDFSAGDFVPDAADEMIAGVENDGVDSHRENVTDAYEKYRYKDKTIRTETSDSPAHQTEEAVAEVKEFEDAVTEVIEEELHVSKEELEAAMEELGFTYLDLLDNSNLANLVAKLTGNENVNLLLCNEAFTNVLQRVSALGAELVDKLQMTPKELLAMQETLIQPTVETENTVEAEAVNAETENAGAVNAELTEAAAGDTAEATANATATETADEAVTEAADDMTAAQDVKSEAVSDAENAEETTESKVKVEEVSAENSKEDMTGTSEESMTDGEEEEFGSTNEKPLTQNAASGHHETSAINEASNPVSNQTSNLTFAEQLGQTETVQTLPPQVTVADIMEQFAEQSRVLVSAETTKLEMQLNPEHLGKLFVEITETEGAITAKIMTQNTVVKEALEMQIADLRQNLNQAGVKVDSVEVTIASHEFERNLEQDANSRRHQEDTQPKTSRLRSINLNGLDELSGLMTEEEALVAKMMAEQGNSVDFTA